MLFNKARFGIEYFTKIHMPLNKETKSYPMLGKYLFKKNDKLFSFFKATFTAMIMQLRVDIFRLSSID